MPKWLIIILTIIITIPIAMIGQMWMINKYEVLLDGAYYTHPNLIDHRKKQAAQKWEEFCPARIEALKK